MRKEGFTLVEMLLVLAIVGILVTIIIPSVVGVTMDTKEKKVRADLRQIQAALGQYYVRYNVFPASGSGTWIDNLLAMSPRVINKRPGDPFAPAVDPDNPPLYEYEYRAPVAEGDIPTYAVWSVGVSTVEDVTVVSSDTITHTADCIYVTNASNESTQ